MLNQVILVGRIINIIGIDESIYGRPMHHLLLNTNDANKEPNEITVAVEEHLFVALKSYLNFHILIAIKGRLEDYRTKLLGTPKTVVVAERITYLSGTPTVPKQGE